MKNEKNRAVFTLPENEQKELIHSCSELIDSLWLCSPDPEGKGY